MASRPIANAVLKTKRNTTATIADTDEPTAMVTASIAVEIA